MTAIAVTVLVMEPIRNTVSWVMGVSEAMSATPWPWNHSRDPSRTTPTASPAAGQRSRTFATTACRSRSSSSRIASPFTGEWDGPRRLRTVVGALHLERDPGREGRHLLLPALLQRPLEPGHVHLVLGDLDQPRTLQ